MGLLVSFASAAGVPLHAAAPGDAILPHATPFEPATLHVPLHGVERVLEVWPYSIRADGFQLFVQDAAGLRTADAPPSRVMRGRVAGDAGSRVSGSLSADGAWTLLIESSAGDWWEVAPYGDAARTGRHRVRSSLDEQAHTPVGTCGTRGGPARKPPHSLRSAPTPGLPLSQIAFDTDVQYYNLNGASVPNTLADVEFLMNSASLVYERDAGISWEITAIVVRTVEPDPYDTRDAADLLTQFELEWKANFVHIPRAVAHLMTGKDLDGPTVGLADFSSACFLDFAYALTQPRYTQVLNNRVALLAHELAHNWNAEHCDGDPACHIMCSTINGCSGVGLPNFDAPAVQQINDWLEFADCLGVTSAMRAPPIFEPFAGPPLDATLWNYAYGAAPSTGAQNEPSPTWSVGLNSLNDEPGADDDLRTVPIRLGGAADVILSYYLEKRAVEAGKTFHVEYRRSDGVWVALQTYVSDGVTENSFTLHEHLLPAAALYDGVRFRFRPDGADSSDAWYIDNVSIDGCFAPQITQQPAGGQGCPNQPFVMSVTASGAASYLWRRNGSPLNDGAAFSGTQTPELTIASLSAQSTGQYTCDVDAECGLFGGPITQTAAASVTLGSAPQITQHPADSSVNSGGVLSLSVSATGSGLSYEWSRNDTPLADDGRITGAAAASLTISPVQPGDAGAYRCRVASGACATDSDPADVTVQTDCPGDANGDGMVGNQDLQQLLNAWGAQTGDPAFDTAVDFVADGRIDNADLQTVLVGWSIPCP